MSEPLNLYNGLNVAAFALSWLLNSAIGEPEAVFNGMENLRRRYESIVTPMALTYLMMHLVLVLQGVFAVCQLMPKYRQSDLVQKGVRHWFFLSAISQLLWSFDLGVEGTFGALLSVALMGLMFFTVSVVLRSQAALSYETQTPEEYWLLRFPFSIQCGWILAVFIESINAFFKELEVGQIFQFILGVLSFGFFVFISWKMLFANGVNPNYIIPSVLAWFTLGITFTTADDPGYILEGLLGLIYKVLSGIVGFGIAGVTGYLFYQNEHVNKNNKLDGAEGSDTVYVSAPDVV